MKSQVLIRRYTQGLINSIKDEAEFSVLSRELSAVSGLLSEHKELRDILHNRFLPASKRKQIVEEVLSKSSYAKKTTRLISLLLENNRLDLLPGIIELIPELWNEKKGISTYEAASVIPLSDVQRKKLKEKLELLEKKPVVLKYRIEPELLGGLWIKRGNIVYDTSVRGHLMKLREKIIEG